MAKIRQAISDVGVVVYGCFWWLKNHIMIPKYEYVADKIRLKKSQWLYHMIMVKSHVAA
jgi:hypothetical protein